MSAPVLVFSRRKLPATLADRLQLLAFLDPSAFEGVRQFTAQELARYGYEREREVRDDDQVPRPQK